MKPETGPKTGPNTKCQFGLPINIPVTGVWDESELAAMQTAANQVGLDLTVDARAGQQYLLPQGGTATLREGKIHLQISGPSPKFTDFWALVNQLKQQST